MNFLQGKQNRILTDINRSSTAAFPYHSKRRSFQMRPYGINPFTTPYTKQNVWFYDRD